MKIKALIFSGFCLLLGLSTPLCAQTVLLDENFSGLPNPPHLPTGWTTINLHAEGEDIELWQKDWEPGSPQGNYVSLLQQSAGNISLLISPVITLPAETNTLSFKINRTEDSPECSTEGIRVWASTSTDTTGGIFLIAVARHYEGEPVQTTEGWTEFSVDIPTTGNIHIIFGGISQDCEPIELDDIKVTTTAAPPPSPCLPPTEITISEQTDNSAELTWTRTSATDNSWIVSYKRTSDTTWFEQPPSTDTTFSLTGLDASTRYSVRIQTICDDDSTSNFSAILNFTTGCPANMTISNFPWVESFENTWMPATVPGNRPAPACWTVIDGGITTNASGYVKDYFWKANGLGTDFPAAFHGMKYASFHSEGAQQPHSDWLITPPLDLTGREILSFHVRNHTVVYGGDPHEEISVFISASSVIDTSILDNLETGFIEILPSTIVSGKTWTKHEINLSAYAGVHRIAFVRRNAPHSGELLCLDAVTIDTLPLCPKPENLTISVTSSTDIEVSYDEIPGSDNGLHFFYIADSAANDVAPTVVEVTGTPYTISDLTPNTSYKAYAKTTCDTDGSLSEDSTAIISFTTFCDAITEFPWLETFASIENEGDKPGCMEWTENVKSKTRASTNFDGRNDSKFVQFSENSHDIVFSPRFFLSPTVDAYHFSFWYSGLVRQNNSVGIKIYLLSSQNIADTIMRIDTLTLSHINNGSYLRFSTSFTVSTPQAYYIGIELKDPNADNFMCLDDLRLATEDCPIPSNLRVSNISDTSANLEWDAVSTANSYTIHYTMDPENEDSVANSTSPSHTVNNLESNTAYSFTVSAHCSPTNSSEFSNPEIFETECKTLDSSGFSLAFQGSLKESCWQLAQGRLEASSTLTTWSRWDLENAHNYQFNPRLGDKYARLYFGGEIASSVQDWLISPSIKLPAGKEYQISFDAVLSQYDMYTFTTSDASALLDNCRFAVVISFDNGNTWESANAKIWDTAGNYQDIRTISHNKQNIIVPIGNRSISMEQTIRFAFYLEANQPDHQIAFCLNNVEIEEKDPCPIPKHLTLNSVSSSSANIRFSSPESLGLWEYEVVDTSATFVGTVSGNTTTSPLTVDNLLANTSYKIRLRQNCSTIYSPWTQPLKFKTRKQIQSIPFLYDFEETDLNLDIWTIHQLRGKNQWVLGNQASSHNSNALYIAQDSSTTTHSYNHRITATSLAYLDIDFKADSLYSLSFDWICLGENSSDFLMVLLQGIDDDLPSTISSLTQSVVKHNNKGYLSAQSTWTRSFTELPVASTNGPKRLVFAWHNDHQGGANPPAAIDNIQIAQISCQTPSDLATAFVTPTSAIINWTESGTSTAWKLNVSDTTEISASTNPHSLTELSPETTYTIKVKSVCTPNMDSEWSEIISFTTLAESPACETPSSLAVANITASSATINWTESGTATAWKINVSDTTEISASTNPYSLTELTAETTYTVKVKSICTDNESEWSDTIVFTTLEEAPIAVPATVITNAVDEISDVSAKLNASFTQGSEAISSKGFEWKNVQDEAFSEILATAENAPEFSAILAGLTPNTNYIVKAFIIENEEKIYGEEQTFQTDPTPLSLNLIEQDASNVQIYPNPAQEMISVEIEGMQGRVSISITDLQGKLVNTTACFVENHILKTTIDVSNLTSGIYSITFTNEQKSITKKLVIK